MYVKFRHFFPAKLIRYGNTSMNVCAPMDLQPSVESPDSKRIMLNIATRSRWTQVLLVYCTV